MKNKLFLVIVIIFTFIAGAICGNVFEVKEAEAKKYKTLVEWERVGQRTFRAKMPGGWLVYKYMANAGGGVTFVPDPGYRWQ